jgi:uncharacterized protein YecE (DUF72 family)
MSRIGQYHVGTSGWNYKHWRERFYPRELPARKWFEHYAGVFRTVEINNTFYHLPEAATFTHWREQAPEGFLYAVKASRYITHVKRLKDPRQPVGLFLQRARRLWPHLGPILYQLPPNFKPDLERLEGFCKLLPRALTHVMEFRQADWLREEVFDLLGRYHVCLCVHDLLPDHPRRLTGQAAYVRFHGVGNKYGGNYSRAELRRWADWMRQTAQDGHDVYAYFNNDSNAYAVFNAQTLRKLLSGA